ncbi:hypothetical protein IVA80_34630 [Bradyrhizobium sp. 139]|uniref:hypothetical protein n=1 Tax=Bradyrhizobium sp. 139 TaxID=2782616 RepID=UPI001FF8CCC6|nr:hypothetical protein [Bradyrhizobium sp. 139]MCK1745764.1 hypothetical protein [Bradyrhizobium sp. 139]
MRIVEDGKTIGGLREKPVQSPYGTYRRRQEVEVSEQEMKYSDLVEIARCSSDLKQSYGENKGALLTAFMAYLATRPRSLVRPWWIAAGIAILYGALKLWLH